MSLKYKRRAPAKVIVMGVLFVVMALAATAGIVTVLALTSRSISSNVNITYTAVDIDGEVEAAYKIGDSGTWTSMNGSSPYRFSADDQTSNKQMSPANIELTSQNRYVEFRYIFRNYGHVDYTAILSLNEVDENNNIKLDYKYNDKSYTPTGYGLVIEGTNSPVLGKVQTNEDGEEYVEMTYYVKASVKQLTRDANYQSDFFWLLENYEAQPGEETIRLATSEYSDNGDGTFSASYSGANISVANMMSGGSNIENIWNVPSRFGSASVTKVKKGDDLPANTKVVLSDSITTIEYGTFSSFDPLVYGSSLGSQGLVEIVIGNGVSELSTYMFGYCSNLRNVTIGNGVTTINKGAFYGCEKLTSIIIPNTVTSIEGAVFQYCGRLEEVVISSSVTKISDHVFSECSSLKEIIIPNGVTSIDSYAFINCAGLKEITIPSSVTSIGSHAFAGCTAVEVLNYNASVTTPFSSSPFSNLGQNAARTVVNVNSTIVPNYLFCGCEYIDEINIGNSVTSIGTDAFDGCVGVEVLNYNASVTETSYQENTPFSNLGKDAAKTVVNINSRIVPSSMFCRDATFDEVNFGNNVYEISAFAFYYNESLQTIIIPGNVEIIGFQAFYSTPLTEIVLKNGIKEISSGAFWNIPAESIWIPESVTIIHDGGPPIFNIIAYCEASSKPSGWELNMAEECGAVFHYGYTYEQYLAEINK